VPSARTPSRRHRPLVALLLGAALALTGSGAAAAYVPDAAAQPDRGRDTYVALGDSFSAGNGTGLPDLDPACYRSSLAYAPLVAAERPDTSLTFVACGFGVTTQTVVDTQVGVLDRQTDFVTLSVGGNDLGFAQLAGTCVLATELQCLGLTAQTAAFVETVLPSRLDATYDAVRERVRKAEVVVVGYPRFFAADYVPCLQSQGITAVEAAALNDLVETLDAVIADRAAAAGFTYVSVVDAFDGHDMCAAEPWVNGVVAASQADVYHPTAAGHRDGYAPLVAAELEKRRPSVSLLDAA
jgi:lysophospholipase L1-like esterase